MAAKFKVDLPSGFPNWSDDVGAWATSSGGGTIASHPTSADSANFDVNSGNCVVDVSSACSNLLCTAYVGTISGSADLSVGAGAVNQFGLVAGMTWSYTGALTFAPNGAGRKITSAGKTLANFTLNATTGTNGSTLQDAFTVSGAVTVMQGALSTGTNFALVCGSLASSNTNTRSITFGSSTVTLTGTGTVWTTATATNLTLSAASSTIVISTSAGATTFAGGGLTYGNLTLSGADTVNNRTFTGTNTFATFTSGANKLAFTDAQTATAFVFTGCLSLTGNLVQAAGTVTFNASGRITNSAASGGATFDANGAANGGGNSGWTNFASGVSVPTLAASTYRSRRN